MAAVAYYEERWELSKTMLKELCSLRPFESRREAIDVVIRTHLNHKGYHFKNGTKKGGHFANICCDGCEAFHVTIRGRKGDTEFICIEDESCLFHGGKVVLENGELLNVECPDLKNATIKEVLENNQYKTMKASASNLSLKTIQNTLNSGSNPIDVTIPTLKKAAGTLAWSREKHEAGFSRLDPFMQQLKFKNPGLLYTLHLHPEDGTLHSLCIVMPWAAVAWPFLFQVLGIDGAHVKNIVFDDHIEPRLLYANMTVTFVSSRTPDNRMIVLGLALSPTEHSETIGELLHLLIDREGGAGLTLNAAHVTAVTDRGGAIAKAVREVIPLAFHMACGWHLEISVLANSKGKSKDNIAIKALFWRARNAHSLVTHLRVMDELAAYDEKHGTEAYVYLSGIAHWAMHELLARGVNMLYDIQSSNLSEQVCSWALPNREQPPYYMVENIMFRLFELVGEQRTAANKHMDMLTPHALNVWQEVTDKLQAQPQLVACPDPVKGLNR